MKKTLWYRLLFLCLNLLILFSLLPTRIVAAEVIASGKCGNGQWNYGADRSQWTDLDWSLDSYGTLTISGTGDMWHENSSDYSAIMSVPWETYKSSIKKVIIEEGVTSIGPIAFSELTDITEITIPTTVTLIDEFAFWHCDNLVTVTIPKSVSVIKDYAFCWCPIKNVYYSGSETQWQVTRISNRENGNSTLINATIHYNRSAPVFKQIIRHDIPISGTAIASTQAITIGKKRVQLPAYALLDNDGNPTNYVRLRDLAQLLNGTEAQFDVTWSKETGIYILSGTAYIHPNGTEAHIPFTGNQPFAAYLQDTTIDDEKVSLTAFQITWDGASHTFYQLRDLGKTLNFNVGWSQERGIYIETDKPYSDAD